MGTSKRGPGSARWTGVPATPGFAESLGGLTALIYYGDGTWRNQRRCVGRRPGRPGTGPPGPCWRSGLERRGPPAPSSGVRETPPTETQHPEVWLGASHGHSLPGTQPSSRPPAWGVWGARVERTTSWAQTVLAPGALRNCWWGGTLPQIRAPRHQSGPPRRPGSVRSRSACRAPAPAPRVTRLAWFF